MTELVRKLGITPGCRLGLIDLPPESELFVTLPDGVDVRRQARGRFDVIVMFSIDRAELARRLPLLARTLQPDGGLWLAWPKRSSGVATDLSDGVVRQLGLAAGLVDNKVCAIDGTWSALRFVYRLADRPPRVTSG